MKKEGKFKSKWPAVKEAIKELLAWLFATFLLPLVQLFIIVFSNNPSIVYENVYNILFVTIASFLTGIFFVTNFWQQNRILVRMMLVISYLISFGLYIFSLVYVMFGNNIFEQKIYKWGVMIALLLAVLVGFFSKYDEKMAVSRGIVNDARNKTEGSFNGKQFKI